jgi:class 3 adenylate cyclase
VTKVTDADIDNSKTIAALVVGVPFLETSEKAMSDFSKGGIESGIWLEDKLHSKTIPANLRNDFSQIILNKMKTPEQPQDTLHITLGGIPRQVFFKLLNPHSPFPPAYQVSLYSMAGATKTERELRWQILAFSSAALAGALVLSLLLAHGLSIPLRELVKGTVAIRGGDFTVKVPVRSRDEVGQLAASFNEMAEGLTQKEVYRTVLNMVADEKVAHALVNGQLKLGGEVREISVLFCDIRGFTPLTENMPPETVIEMLNEHMTALTRVVKEHHGVLDKFVGDLLMAIFGAPVSAENDTLNAARCALRLIEERERLNATSQHQLQIGVSVATGKVVAGCMGSTDRLNYTVLGERVNLASRLCSVAIAGQVIIDETTHAKLGGQIKDSPLAPISVKGFSEKLLAYELTSVD